MRDRTALKNRKKNLTIPLLKRQCRQRLDEIARHLEALDAEIAGIIAADPMQWKGKSFIRGDAPTFGRRSTCPP